MHGAEVVWGLQEQLLAAVFDVLRMANWQRSGKGEKPKPLPRPGVTEDKTVKRFGTGSMNLQEAAKWKRRRRNGGGAS